MRMLEMITKLSINGIAQQAWSARIAAKDLSPGPADISFIRYSIDEHQCDFQ